MSLGSGVRTGQVTSFEPHAGQVVPGRRAVMALQDKADVGSYHYIDNLSRAIRQVGRVVGDLIPKVYSVPRIIRTLGPQGEQKEVVVAPREDHGNLPPEMQAVAQKQAQMADTLLDIRDLIGQIVAKRDAFSSDNWAAR